MDAAMIKTHGFSIRRNYTMQIDRSVLFVWSEDGASGASSGTAQAAPEGFCDLVECQTGSRVRRFRSKMSL